MLCCAVLVACCVLLVAVRAHADLPPLGNNAQGFLSVPAWIYLILTPRYSRSAKFASPRLMLAVDGVFTFIWLCTSPQ